MTNPLIPGITAAEQDVLYQKLNAYNLKKASFKEVGAYLVVLPRADCPRYSLWIYSPLPERQSIFYIFDLSEDIHEALRMASTLCYYSSRPLSLVEYNAKRMQNKATILSRSANITDIICMNPADRPRLSHLDSFQSSLPEFLNRNASHKSPGYTIPYTLTSCNGKPSNRLPDAFLGKKGKK